MLVIIFIILLCFSAFFAASETALFSISFIRAAVLLKQHRRNAKIIYKLKQDPKKLVIAILIGNTVANVAASVLATIIATKYLGPRGPSIAFGVAAFLILLFGEILPKSMATAHAITLASIIAKPLEIIIWLLSPIVWIFEKIAHFTGSAKPHSFTGEEIKIMAEMGVEAGTVAQEEKNLIEKVFRFSDITTEDVMTPRTKMFCLQPQLTLVETLEATKPSHFSRIPVFEGNPDNIIGILYIKEILNYPPEELNKIYLRDIIKEPFFIPGDKPIDELLKEFQKISMHIAIVVNEHGEVIGLITLEDILEELVGEIIDEKDINEILIKRIDKNTILADANTEIQKINHFFNVELPEDEYKTISGLILGHLGRIPKAGEELQINNVKLKITEVTPKSVIKVQITK